MLSTSPEHGKRLAAIVSAGFGALLEGVTPDQARELLEGLADGAAVRQALAGPAGTLKTPWSTSEWLLPYRAAQLTHLDQLTHLELRHCRLLLLGPDPHRQGTRLHNLPIHGFTQNQISCKLVVWEGM